MRKLLRRGVRGFLWIIKGLLLLIAVGAAVMWPVSRGRMMGGRAERYTAAPASVKYRGYTVECWDGRAVLVCAWLDAGGGPRLIEVFANGPSAHREIALQVSHPRNHHPPLGRLKFAVLGAGHRRHGLAATALFDRVVTEEVLRELCEAGKH